MYWYFRENYESLAAVCIYIGFLFLKSKKGRGETNNNSPASWHKMEGWTVGSQQSPYYDFSSSMGPWRSPRSPRPPWDHWKYFITHTRISVISSYLLICVKYKWLIKKWIDYPQLDIHGLFVLLSSSYGGLVFFAYIRGPSGPCPVWYMLIHTLSHPYIPINTHNRSGCSS